MEEFVLYILMRTDIESLQGGKGMAQAAHAANQFMKNPETEKSSGYKQWLDQSSSGTFGTTIVLDVNSEVELELIINKFKDSNHVRYSTIEDTVLDDTFPIKDGLVTFTVPVVTCGYVFAPLGEKRLDHLDLYPTFS